ncbi:MULTISPECIES: aminopeptidase N [unclassified Iodidimonas]|jgi:aminopeptidase N|uniref:aminopeptidase N n=1 Tax=unclassified Iodidimonas TaxID=2626145 RepID=UPI0024824229|nr:MULTISPECIES: aminopeptidase N [unclassified Iodidimonas]
MMSSDQIAAENETRPTIYLKDYQPPAFRIEQVDLDFDLQEEGTRVKCRMVLQKLAADQDDLVLDGDAGLKLLSITLDGQPVAADRLHRQDETLRIKAVPDHFTLETVVEIEPQKNDRLEGLYRSGGQFCTQCEAEGFRNITFFLDRPDVMSIYHVRITADKALYPVLLSNGNLVDSGDLANGRHFALWHDPFQKPSYLFALVAGDLDCLKDHFTTRSGRDVSLNIYARTHDLPKCRHAMESLKRAMRWDEEVYGLEYDLSIFNIVAVSDFNMGAMENKSLNIFNTKYVLADPEISTDDDFDHVEGVIAHEYFHNWTGNRITCRDWFQLSLKEGLTVFRDQEYSSDQGSRAIKRIQDVRILRAHQFAEDDGPMAHPVRPESYMEINNFYTVTVYNKGAELIRMMHRILGADGFHRGMDLYVQRHDGQAVTCDDFVAAMEDANGADLSHFALWYSQAGTPHLDVHEDWDDKTKTYSLYFKQYINPTPGQSTKAALHIPVLMGLIGPNGGEMAARLIEGDADQTDKGLLLHVKEAEAVYRFTDLAAKPVPSLLRQFSAPVQLSSPADDEQKHFLVRHDQDEFSRWEACQDLMIDAILKGVSAISQQKPMPDVSQLIESCAALLKDADRDPAFTAEILSMPSEAYIGQKMTPVAVDAIHEAHQYLKKALAEGLASQWRDLYDQLANKGPYELTAEHKARRALRSVALLYLCFGGDSDPALKHYQTADNMSDRLAALRILSHSDDDDLRERIFADFYNRLAHEPLAIDKWFAMQALSLRPDCLDRVKSLLRHDAFSLRNPNRLRALVGSFAAGNQLRFHDISGEGYRFLGKIVGEVDRFNPQTAARLILPLSTHKRFDPKRSAMMTSVLRDLAANKDLSRDVYEILTKSISEK